LSFYVLKVFLGHSKLPFFVAKLGRAWAVCVVAGNAEPLLLEDSLNMLQTIEGTHFVQGFRDFLLKLLHLFFRTEY
jgi:hypothetical protein